MEQSSFQKHSIWLQLSKQTSLVSFIYPNNAFSLVVSIIVYMPSQSTIKKKYFHH